MQNVKTREGHRALVPHVYVSREGISTTAATANSKYDDDVKYTAAYHHNPRSRHVSVSSSRPEMVETREVVAESSLASSSIHQDHEIDSVAVGGGGGSDGVSANGVHNNEQSIHQKNDLPTHAEAVEAPSSSSSEFATAHEASSGVAVYTSDDHNAYGQSQNVDKPQDYKINSDYCTYADEVVNDATHSNSMAIGGNDALNSADQLFLF